MPGGGSLTVAPNDATALAAWSKAGPAANPQQLNRYTYVLNNPLKSGDPTGHCIPGPFLVWCAVVVGSFITEVVIPAIVGAAVIAGAAEAGKQLGEAQRAANAQNQEAEGSDDSAQDLSGRRDVPDEHVVVRGGTSALPEPGSEFSGSHGPTVEDAAAGVPHGTVRVTTAGAIRTGGGSVVSVPEEAYPGGPINEQHVNVRTGNDYGGFSDPIPNPVPKKDRIPGRPQ